MKRMMINRLHDYYPNAFLMGDGIFTDLQKLDVPWQNLDAASLLDIEYISRSGNKLVGGKLRDREIPLSIINRNTIASIIYVLHKKRWERLYEVMQAQYDPIANYDMTENETVSSDRTDVITDSGTTTETGTRNYSDSGTVNNNGTNTNVNSVWGFNSSTDVNSDKDVYNVNNTETRNLNSIETPNITNSESSTRESEGESNETRTLTRRGNIGVTTSQQLLQSQIELWQWSYFEQVFNDIDRELTLQVY